MKAYLISILVLVPFLVFGQITKPTTTSQPTTTRSLKKTTTKPARSATRPGRKITTKPTSSQASNASNSGKKAPMLSTFTDGSPYIDPTPFINSITAEDLREHLTILASDEFEGRETGTKGNRMAANYIAQHFTDLGLPRVDKSHSYFQKVNFFKQSWEKLSVMANDETMRTNSDFLAPILICLRLRPTK